MWSPVSRPRPPRIAAVTRSRLAVNGRWCLEAVRPWKCCILVRLPSAGRVAPRCHRRARRHRRCGRSRGSCGRADDPAVSGVTYESSVQFTPHGPVAIHVVRGPRPVACSDSGRCSRTSRSCSARRSRRCRNVSRHSPPRSGSTATSSPRDGRPSGIFLRDGVLATPPNAGRSSVGIVLDGTLDVRKVRFRGTWRGRASDDRSTS